MRNAPFLFRKSIVISLILFLTLLFCSIESVAQIKLAWDPNTEPDMAGYRVYYGTASRTYGTPIDVGNVTTYTSKGLSQRVVHHIAVTAYNMANYESAYSNEVSGQITEAVSPLTVLQGRTSGTVGTPTLTALEALLRILVIRCSTSLTGRVMGRISLPGVLPPNRRHGRWQVHIV